MNATVIFLSVVLGAILGGIIWWTKKSVVGAIAIPVVLVGFAFLVLPRPIQPLVPPEVAATQPRSVPAAPAPVPTATKLAAFRPIEVQHDGYVASDACRECHPQNHATWFASYHRTMTQVAHPDIVLGDFDDVKLSYNANEFHLRKEGDVCWAEMLDPAARPGTPEASVPVRRPIVMTTGSHHMQAYWFPVGVERTLAILPFVFLNETQEWIPRAAAFLKPERDGVSHEIGRWNEACSKCHSTHPQERGIDFGQFDTRAAEFGISCEACHGPGEKHIAYHRSLDSQKDDSSSLSSDPIANPENMTHVRSSQVCGQCHGVMTGKGDFAKINWEGNDFRPGDDLRDHFTMWQLGSPEMKQMLANPEMHDQVVSTNRATFYSDGIVRVSGREYTAMQQSACFQRGEISCLSCHQLHKSSSDKRSDKEWANDQLKPTGYANDACTQCHDQQQYSTAHTHHAEDSSGSNCYNCHMPHTAYGLLKAIRNHTISNPDLSKDLAANRPNACNQCHLDKPLKWTAQHLEDWYSIEPPELDAEQTEIAASVLWLLKGDAANRALAAWAMGWSEAQAASGDDWQSIYLAQLLNDPYLAIRLIARRSLETLAESADLKIKPLGSSSERGEAILSIIKQWDKDSHEANPALLIGPKNAVRTRRIDALLKQRDDTPMNLAE